MAGSRRVRSPTASALRAWARFVGNWRTNAMATRRASSAFMGRPRARNSVGLLSVCPPAIQARAGSRWRRARSCRLPEAPEEGSHMLGEHRVLGGGVLCVRVDVWAAAGLAAPDGLVAEPRGDRLTGQGVGLGEQRERASLLAGLKGVEDGLVLGDGRGAAGLAPGELLRRGSVERDAAVEPAVGHMVCLLGEAAAGPCEADVGGGCGGWLLGRGFEAIDVDGALGGEDEHGLGRRPGPRLRGREARGAGACEESEAFAGLFEHPVGASAWAAFHVAAGVVVGAHPGLFDAGQPALRRMGPGSEVHDAHRDAVAHGVLRGPLAEFFGAQNTPAPAAAGMDLLEGAHDAVAQDALANEFPSFSDLHDEIPRVLVQTTLTRGRRRGSQWAR